MNVPPIGPLELAIILVIVLVIFGPRRLKNIGSEIGNSIKGFRNAMKEQDKEDVEGTDESQSDKNSQQDPPKQTHA